MAAGPPQRGYRTLKRTALAYARIDALVRRAQEKVRRWAGDFLGEALTAEEQSALGVALYDRTVEPPSGGGSLWDWERLWLVRRLPPPPATVLVGGAGTGREVGPLRRLGYRIDAFDPARRAAACCAQVLGDAGRVAVGSYEDLSRAVLDGAGNGLSAVAAGRYQGVLLGWGSFTHVLTADQRRRVLTACDRLAPAGPLLASFWTRWSHDDGLRTNGDSRARRVGAWVRELRRADGAPGVHNFGGWCGFAHTFDLAEIETLALGIGRRVIWESEGGGHPHVTLLPRGSIT